MTAGIESSENSPILPLNRKSSLKIKMSQMQMMTCMKKLQMKTRLASKYHCQAFRVTLYMYMTYLILSPAVQCHWCSDQLTSIYALPNFWSSLQFMRTFQIRRGNKYGRGVFRRSSTPHHCIAQVRRTVCQRKSYALCLAMRS